VSFRSGAASGSLTAAHHPSERAAITNRARPARAAAMVSRSPRVGAPHLKLSTTGLRTHAARRRVMLLTPPQGEERAPGK
jgi:hypothetical protein